MDSGFSNQVKYNCSINANNKEFEFINPSFNFTFIGQEGRIITNTYISTGKSQNLLEISENIFDKKLYILGNSLVYLYNNNYKFNINGTLMNDEIFPYDTVNLTLNLDNYKNKILNATCSSKKSENNYILSCNSTRAIKEKIISGFAALENANLFINVTEQTGFSSSNSYYFSKKNSSISTGSIIGIIMALLIVIISLILLFCYLKKKKSNKSKKETEESSIDYMKNYL